MGLNLHKEINRVVIKYRRSMYKYLWKYAINSSLTVIKCYQFGVRVSTTLNC